MSRLVAVLLVCVAFLGLTACDSQDPVDEARMGGIEVRTEGNEWLGSLGDPIEPPGTGEGPLSLTGYPNPASATARFRFDLAQPSAVDLWVERVEPTNAFHALVSAAIPEMPRGTDPSVRVLRSGETLPAGSWEVPWDGSDANGQPLTRGYFRVWLRVGNVTRSWDLLRVASEEELNRLLFGA